MRNFQKRIEDSLRMLSQILFEHYGKKSIILIDEYDVPLDKAFQHGYYKEMVSLLRGLFGQALKTNEFLQFAVLTGCLRVSKESIFTGLNNFKVLSIADVRFDEQFGFTDDEVRKLLKDYDLVKRFVTKARNKEKENFYHGMMLGLLRNHRNWVVKSNVEAGEGFVDILLKPENPDEGILIELKYSKTFDGLEKACERSMEQIKDRRYDEALREEGRTYILAYGIAFCKKRCKVVVQKI